MSSRPFLVEDENLSRAWVRGVEALALSNFAELAPLVVSVRLADDAVLPMVPSVTARLDSELRNQGLPTSNTTANLIFPAFWNPERPRQELFERYLRMLPRIRRVRANQYGIYFERLLAFGSERYNQLEYIISTYNGNNHRRSALQASILDPAVDHTNQRQRGFPCLQQVSFSPDSGNGLTVTGYYATQYLVSRAYGNYLGLCRLGRFVAHEIGRKCTRMTCVAAAARLGDGWSKRWARGQLASFGALLRDAAVPAPFSDAGDTAA